MEKRKKSFQKMPLHEKQQLIGEMLEHYCEETVVNELKITKEELKSFSDSLEKQKHQTLSDEEMKHFTDVPMSLHKFRQLRPDLQFQFLELYTKTYRTSQLTQFWLITSNYFYVLKTRVKKAFQEWIDKEKAEEITYSQEKAEEVITIAQDESAATVSEEDNNLSLVISLNGTYNHYDLAMQLHSIADLLARNKDSYHINLELKKD